MKKISVLALVGLMVLSLAFSAASVFAQATTKSLSTVYTVQNLGTATANIEVDYMQEYDGTTPGGDWTADPANTTFTVTAGTSKVVAQYLDSTLADGAGSATIRADQPVAAIVNMLARGQTPTSGSYTAFGEGAESFYMPFAFKNLVTSVGAINSQLIIMNVGTADTDVDVALINGVTGAVDYTKEILALPAGESFYYDQSLETSLADGWYGSAQVVADAGGSIAVVGNQFTGDNGLLTYPGFAEGYTEWVVPLYLSRLSNGYNSVIAIQNVSGGTIAAGDIEVVFTPDPSLSAASFTISNTAALDDNATWTVNPRSNDDFPVGSFGAAKITASGDVVAIINQLVNEPPNYSDSALSYNAIPANLTGETVVVPLVMSRLPNGYSTVMTIANLTDTAGTCDVTYTGDPGYGSSDVTVTGVTLPAGGSFVHNHRLEGTTGHNLPADWYGAATVECTQAVAGVVNQLQAGASGDPDLSYNAFTTD
ncbi:MAG: hypothetical protein SXV54_00525 [Chloroflexota bacterium]|nr:hypothetical protein [Chloroflexota bacterium]